MLVSRLEALAAEHAPRFAIEIHERHGQVMIVLEHPASVGTTLVVQDLCGTSVEQFARWLRENPEIQRIERGPEPMPHAELCLRVYNACQALGWDGPTLGEVTGMLCDVGALTEGERNWLRSTSYDY